MNNTTPVALLPPAGVALLLLFTLLAPTAAAQEPPLPGAPSSDSALGLALGSENGFVQVPFPLSGATSFTIYDVSGDSGAFLTQGQGRMTAKPHIVSVDLVNKDEIAASGWQVQLGASSFQMYGGDTADVPVVFVTTPLIKVQTITAEVVAEFLDTATGHTMNQTINLTGQVLPYGLANARMLTFPQKAPQFEIVKYDVLIENFGVYPDRFTLDVTIDKAEFKALPPGPVYIPGMDSRIVTVSVQTPKGQLYEFGENAQLTVKVRSERTGAEYSVVGIMKVEGWYVSSYWLPLLVVGLISAGVVTRESKQQRELRRLEKGRPRRVQPTPRQTVLLAELRRRDPEAYKQQKARLDALYKSRRGSYRDERKQINAHDKEERRQAKVEYAEAIRRKKAQRIADKKQAKIDRKEAKKQRKIEAKAAKAQRKVDKVQAKVDARERKRLEKQLDKRRKVLEKARAKATKQEAQQQRAEAKAARKAERASRKSAKGRDGKP